MKQDSDTPKEEERFTRPLIMENYTKEQVKQIMIENRLILFGLIQSLRDQIAMADKDIDLLIEIGKAKDETIKELKDFLNEMIQSPAIKSWWKDKARKLTTTQKDTTDSPDNSDHF